LLLFVSLTMTLTLEGIFKSGTF